MNSPQSGSAQPGAAHGNGRTAFIIEDDPAFNDMLANYLRTLGYQVAQHYRGQDAAAVALKLRPALITLDIILPDLDGWEVLRALRSYPTMQRVPILIISILDEGQLGGDYGPTTFLTKPTNRAELTEAIDRLAPPSDRPRHVLAVDDDPLMIELIGAMLPPAQFRLQTASSAQQATERLSAGLPDLILLDLIMPSVSGLEFLQAVRADPRTRHLPVLVLTAKHLSPREQIDLNRAARVAITKRVFSPALLAEKVRHLQSAHALFWRTDPVADREAHPAPGVDLAQFHKEFLSEARTCLSELDAGLAPRGWAQDDALANATRAAHTLKGAAAVMGYSELSDTAARAEGLLLGLASGGVGDDWLSLRELHHDMARMLDSLAQ
jgi:CheY-like chemotaxis protein/HPt (histidine-containing phosphotransfer) domain-containing protein